MRLLIVILCLLIDIQSFAQKKTDKSEKPAQKTNVLDFDADVIEGERKTPNVFLEIGTENPTMDSVIFQRNDFNDLHILDAKRRQLYQPIYSK